MKNYLTIAAILLSISCFAQLSDTTTQTKLVLVRPINRAGSSSNVHVNINDSMRFWMINNSYMSIDVQPGTYTIKDKKKKKGWEKVTVAAGQTVYVEIHPVVNLFSGYWEFLVADSTQARRNLNNKGIHNMRKPYLRPFSRVGLSMNMGGGFDNIPVGKTTDDEEITFSYGGGLGFELSYGTELSRNFDLMFSLGWHESEMSPNVKDASMSFSRFNVSATGFYMIPLQGGYTSRIKLGAGPDYIFSNTFKADLPSVGGSKPLNTTWDYKEAVGFHGTFLYQVNMSKVMSLDMGLRYNYAAYVFSKSSDGTYPIDKRISKPDGQGIFFILGLNYHF